MWRLIGTRSNKRPNVVTVDPKISDRQTDTMLVTIDTSASPKKTVIAADASAQTMATLQMADGIAFRVRMCKNY